MNRLRKLILSYDTVIALVIVIISNFIIPCELKNQFCYKIYEVAITVLSIIFSIFFASLTVIMAFPDNKFIALIEKDNKLFTALLNYFKDTLYALFISLVITIIIYITTSYYGENISGNRNLFIAFLGVFTYSLIATITAVNATLKITSSRATFIVNSISNHNQSENEKE